MSAHTKPKAKLELTEEDGIVAIQFLQRIAWIKETPERARVMWQKLSPKNQAFTIEFYNKHSVEELERKHAQKAWRQ